MSVMVGHSGENGFVNSPENVQSEEIQIKKILWGHYLGNVLMI